MEFMEKYGIWRDSKIIDEATRAELLGIADDSGEIQERFYRDLEFGTGGLRGIMGAGTNRMNVYTIRRAALGLAEYILANEPRGRQMGVVIAHDSRRNSPLFALEAALTMVSAGIRVYLFDSLRPTPVLSFAVRHLGCTAGVVITASHNPPEYNGFKAYWADGGQIPYPRDEEVIGYVNRINDMSRLAISANDAALAGGLLITPDESVDEAYYSAVLARKRDQAAIDSAGLKIVYTPLHGAGNIPTRTVLARAGFADVFVPEAQADPDPDFTTVSYPNPEDPKAFALGLALGAKMGADIIIANDPDADRVGAMAAHNGEFVGLTGNELGVLMTHYLLNRHKEQGDMPENPAIVSTIVSTNLTRAIAEDFGAAYFEVLTGFKYIGEKMTNWEQTKEHSYVFGFEESIGFLPGDYARDKDAVAASLLICEMAAHYKAQGLTLIDAMNKLLEKYGYHYDYNISITKTGMEGAAQIRHIMEDLRKNPPADIGGISVAAVRDYRPGYGGLPPSDVLYYELADNSWFCIRPSGTEPKIKIYCGVIGENPTHAAQKARDLADLIVSVIN